MQRIMADLLIPGRGEPVENGCVAFDGGVITYAGSAADAPAAASEDTTVEVPVVLPGLWDCHAHFMGVDQPDIARLLSLPPELAVLRGARDARAALMAGITSIREVGGHGVLLARAAAEGTILAPRIYGAAGVLSVTGGHGDIHGFPLDWIHEHPLTSLCDGVPECLRQVRRQLRRGATIIKVCASGGVMSELDDPNHQQFSDEELAAIVAEAARAERSVAAHCHGKAGIMAALRAGVLTIEHGSCLDEEAAEAMLEREAILVPTRFIIARLLEMEEQLPDYAWRKATAFAEQHAQALKLAVNTGVRIAAGTDIFLSGPLWDRNGEELALLAEAGMTPLAAIEAATANGPATLGPQAPRSGLLTPGCDADVIAVDADPLADLGVLSGPEHVTHVWLGGEAVKTPSGG